MMLLLVCDPRCASGILGYYHGFRYTIVSLVVQSMISISSGVLGAKYVANRPVSRTMHAGVVFGLRSPHYCPQNSFKMASAMLEPAMSSKISPFILDDVPNGQEAVGRRSELSSNRGRLIIPLEQELVILIVSAAEHEHSIQNRSGIGT